MKCLVLLVCIGRAVAPISSAADGDTPSTKQFQILETQQINLGNRSIFYHRVSPPNLPDPPPPPAPVQLSPAEEAALLQAQSRERKVIFVSATIYDRRVTELRWFDEEREIRAFSNIDFNYFAGTSDFETEHASYCFLMGIGNEAIEQWKSLLADRALPDRVKNALRDLMRVPASQPSFLLVEEDATSLPHQRVRADLEALHTYYRANWQRMQDDFRVLEAQLAAGELWLREHPPVPQDTVIHFWPKKNSRYLSPNEGPK